MVENKKKTLLLIDSNSLIHRAYHAYPPNLSAEIDVDDMQEILKVLEQDVKDYCNHLEKNGFEDLINRNNYKTKNGKEDKGNDDKKNNDEEIEKYKYDSRKDIVKDLQERVDHLKKINKKFKLQTNVIYGFTSLLLKAWKDHDPDYLICCFDKGKATIRLKKYKEYKSHRKPIEADMLLQIPWVKKVVKSFKIPIYEKAGYEADDLIGTLSQKAAEKGLETVILTGDNDILQLVDDQKKIKVHISGGGFSKAKDYLENEVNKKFGFGPDRIVDYKALRGDPSDNIPGIKGVGKKSATALIKKFDDLDQIFKSAENNGILWQEKPFKRMYKKIINGKKQAFLSYDLAKIIIDVPINLDLKAAQAKDYSMEFVKKLFLKLNFKSLLQKLPQNNQIKKNNFENEINQSGQFNLLNINTNGRKEVLEKQRELYIRKTEKNHIIIREKSEALDHLTKLQRQASVSFDIEASSIDFEKAELLGIGFGYKDKNDYKAIYFQKKFVLKKEVLEKIIDLFISKTQIIAHNLKYDLHVLLRCIYDFYQSKEKVPKKLQLRYLQTKSYFDTLVGAYLLNAGEQNTNLGLKDLAYSFLKIEMLTYKKMQQIAKSQVDHELLAHYCLEDCLATYKLYEIFDKKLKNDKFLNKLFHDIEMPLIAMLIEMEKQGVKIDLKEVEALLKEAKKMQSKIKEDIFEISGQIFNINSPQQVSEILFEKLKIQQHEDIKLKKRKTGAYSTDERTLKNFANNHEIVKKILEYREISKLISTYIKGLKKLVNEKTQKVHTNYNQAIASTGRLSSKNPNLQNIPIASDFGRKIRKAFLPGNNRLFLAFDYAQQELRLLAHLSQEGNLIQAFKNNLDIHTVTASKLFDTQISNITKKQRRVGKTVNFGVIYGISAFGLADRLKIKTQEAQKFIDTFFDRYPDVSNYFDQLKQSAHENNEIRTILGRKRDARALKSRNYQVRKAVEREIINFPLQGSAADMMKLAMIKLRKALQENKIIFSNKVKIHLQIHDEVIFSVPKELKRSKIKSLADQIILIMENIGEKEMNLIVPTKVDVEIGKNWYKLEKLD